MAKKRRIQNVFTGICMDYETAIFAVEDACAVVWVEEGVSVRPATDEESKAARIRFAAIREKKQPLAPAELSHIELKGPIQLNYPLLRAAREFVQAAQWPPKAVVDATIARMEVACSQ